MKPLSSWDAVLAAPPRSPRAALYERRRARSTVARFLEHGLANGDGLVVITTVAHWSPIAARPGEAGIDISAAKARRQLTVLDAHDAVSRRPRSDSKSGGTRC